jgi:hypothetical protein
MRRYALSIIAMAVVAGAGGCTHTGTSNTAGASPSSQVRHVEDVMAELVPNSVADQFRLNLADHTEHLISDCMASHGFTYEPTDPHSLVDVTTDTDFASLTYARTYGFGVTSLPTFTATRHPKEDYLNSLDGAHRKSYELQFPRCADSATELVKQRDGVTEAERRFSRTDSLVQTDPEYRTAMKAWATCAAAAGYSETSRVSLIGSFQTERDLISKRLSSTSPSQSVTKAQDPQSSAGKDPAFQDLRRRERLAAVATFNCSQALDRVYRERYGALR